MSFYVNMATGVVCILSEMTAGEGTTPYYGIRKHLGVDKRVQGVYALNFEFLDKFLIAEGYSPVEDMSMLGSSTVRYKHEITVFMPDAQEGIVMDIAVDCFPRFQVETLMDQRDSLKLRALRITFVSDYDLIDVLHDFLGRVFRKLRGSSAEWSVTDVTHSGLCFASNLDENVPIKS